MPSAASSSPVPRTAERFRLAGPSFAFDARTTAARPDIADIAVAGEIFAPHYARAVDCACTVLAVPVRPRPDRRAPAVSELLRGECFAVLDVAGGWAWGYSRQDHYVGYVPDAALGAMPAPDHVVSVAAALLFAEADIKAPVVARWPMGARFAATPAGDFLAVDDGWVHHRHARLLDRAEADPVAVAERMLGLPYRWGGRGGDGVDCSGLVQAAMQACDIPCPRDSDQQREALGIAVDRSAPRRRGDILFFPGHVGIMLDGERLLHANAHWMAVTAELLADVLARFTVADALLAVRRPA